MDEYNEQTTQQAYDSAKHVMSKAGHKAYGAAKGIMKRAGKGMVKFLAHLPAPIKLLLLKLAIFIAAILLIIGLFGALFNWMEGERGSSGQMDLNPQYENPTYMDGDVRKVAALTEPQALIDAYYKYLSCDSHTKLFVDPNTGEEVWLKFSNTDETADFAALMDIGGKENYFYLSSYFIKMTDELLHNREFYYPEQIIKPVYAAVLPLEGATGSGQKYITTLPLVNDGTAAAETLHLLLLSDETKPVQALINGDSSGLYAIGESLVAAGGEEPKRDPPDSSAPLDFLGRSASYLPEELTRTNRWTEYEHKIEVVDGKETLYVEAVEKTGEEVTSTEFVRQSTTNYEEGIWDYGLGSILQYDAMTKDQYMQCNFTGFYIHTHDVTESAEDDSTSNDDDESSAIRNETCTGKTVFIPVNMGDSVDSVRAAIDAYNTLAQAVVYCPSDAQIAKMVDFAGNQHIEMRIQDSDVALTDAEYDNPILNQVFGNNGTTTYPIKVPVITAAATFSGNIRYEYNMEQYEDELGGRGSFDSNYVDAFSELVYFDGIISDDCSCGALSAYRSGSVISTAPSIIPTEISAPVGFQYIEEYENHYEIYVPSSVKRDEGFQERVQQKQYQSDGTYVYSEELDANKDGILTIMDFLQKLGLLKPYAGGALTAVEGGTLGEGTLTTADSSEEALMEEAGTSNDEEGAVMLLAKAIGAEAGPNKLDQLAVGAVIMNRIYDSRFPNTLIGVLTAPGQYASWTNGSIQAKVPSQQMISSARQVISGEFALPSNVVFQKATTASLEGDVFMTVINGSGYYDHNYSISKYDSGFSSTDIFGRTALTVEQVRQTAEALYQSDIANGFSNAFGDSGISVAGSSSLGLDVVSEYNLFAADGFDVLTAISNMRNIATEEGVLQKLMSGLSEFFANLFQQITAFFDAMNAAMGKMDSDYYMFYNYNVPIQTSYDTVIQAITFTEQDHYNNVADSMDKDALVFLFLGKNSGIGTGTNAMNTGLINGVGATFEGFASPTSSHYQTTAPWSEATGSATIAVPAGVIIQAVGDGVITSVLGEDEGPFIVTQNAATADGKNLIIKYGNLAVVSVADGQSVLKGTKVGEAGEGGLTLSLYMDGVNVNPLQYFYQPTYNSGAAFMNILGGDGRADSALRDALFQQINDANNSKTNTVDSFHQAPKNNKSRGQCTWWAYGRGYQYCVQNGTLPTTGIAPGYGNGGDYYTQGAADFAVGLTARAGSWICWGRLAGTDSSDNYYGHVAFVEAVETNGDIWISETYSALWGRHDGAGIALRKISFNGGRYTYNGNYYFIGFVYLDSPTH